MLTSRLVVKDITRWQDGAAPVETVEQLSNEAGAALLHDNGVRGTQKELESASRDFGGQPLGLGLLASFLKETQNGDVRRRDHIRDLTSDAENPSHDHARRVMKSYEKEWLVGRPVLRTIMHIVGLFDRPASGDCLDALRAEPPILGLTEEIVKLEKSGWQRAIGRLREVRLLAPPDPVEPDALDAHPLVREWFGERLKEVNEATWKAAHGRLYEYLSNNTNEGETPSLEDLAPLYQAIAHGSRAGRHQEVLNKIYVRRLCRLRRDGQLDFYTLRALGAFGSDLAAISWFFDKPYETTIGAFTEDEQSWVLTIAASLLRARGRFAEALLAARVGLRMYEMAKVWQNAAIGAANLGEVELLIGEVDLALITAAKSIEFADKSGDEHVMMGNRATYADVLHAAGRTDEAETFFADAENRERKRSPASPLLYSQRGYQYCELLLAKGDWTNAFNRAVRALERGGSRYPLLDQARDKTTLARANFGSALGASARSTEARNFARAASIHFKEAVDALRASGNIDDVPRGLLANAAFRRSIGDWNGAVRNLEEVEEIAEPGPMQLFLCDMALEHARLAFAKSEAFAPLNGLTDDSPSKPGRPSEAERLSLYEVAAKHLMIAADYLEECDYHRRDEELAELQAVLRGEKKFAELPPRV